MNQELVYIINLYKSHSYHMIKRIFNHLGIPADAIITELVWACLQIKSGVTKCGIEYEKHGTGLTMRDNDIQINFDFNDKGQLDGFDPWWIWEFINDNKIKSSYKTFDDIFNEFAKAQDEEIIEHSESSLYYFSSDSAENNLSCNKSKFV